MQFSRRKSNQFSVNPRERVPLWPGNFAHFRRFIRVLKSLSAKTSFEEYEWDVKSNAIYPGRKALEYLGLGIVDEAGEVAGKIKKLIRDKNGIPDEQFRQEVKKEIGDVAWYITRLSNELGFSLEEILVANTEKLNSRADRGTLKGSGDDR